MMVRTVSLACVLDKPCNPLPHLANQFVKALAVQLFAYGANPRVARLQRGAFAVHNSSTDTSGAFQQAAARTNVWQLIAWSVHHLALLQHLIQPLLQADYIQPRRRR